LTDAVLVVDAQDRLRLANPAAATLFGLSEGDGGNSIVPLVRSADFIELVRRVRVEGDARSMILLNRAPLSDVWIQAAGARTDPEAFGDGAAIFVLADVTALKRLQAMERDFVTNVSHDLRTPVTILRGYAETLAEDQATMSTEDRARFTQKIVSSVGRLQGLVEGLLALASLESAQDVRREPGALHVAAREVAEEFAARCKAAGVKLELKLEAADGGAADPVQARRLVQNLIDNALAHAAGMSRLIVSTRDTLSGVELTVEDDGAGVTPADLPRLFDRFYRTDKSRRAGGSGLGLSIVRQVAELHGGSAAAEPARPKGLRITVTLPAAA
jgi:signal transduction histidine kinase